MCCPQRRVPGKGQFAFWREYPDRIICVCLGCGCYKSGLRQVGPIGNGLHLLHRKAFGVEDYRNRIALQRHSGEDIDLFEAPSGGAHGRAHGHDVQCFLTEYSPIRPYALLDRDG